MIYLDFPAELTPTLAGSDIVFSGGRAADITPTLLVSECDLLQLNICCFMKIGLRKWNFFGVKDFFFMNFDFKNWCKNGFKDNNDKSCSWSRNRVSDKIDFKAVWPRNGHAASGEVKFRKLRVKTIQYELFYIDLKLWLALDFR